jgi:protein-S-isoprenylcysteine O-methyltransferase Ste14
MGVEKPARVETHGRDDLAGEHIRGDAGQLGLAILFAIVYVADSLFLHATTGLNQIIPVAIRVPLGFVVLAVAGFLAKTSLDTVFGPEQAHPGVIRHGLYRYVRHPMYLGEALVYLGLLFLSVSLAAGGVWLIALVFLNAIAHYEERLLLARFGRAYAAYQREIPMWLPRLRRR